MNTPVPICFCEAFYAFIKNQKYCLAVGCLRARVKLKFPFTSMSVQTKNNLKEFIKKDIKPLK